MSSATVSLLGNVVKRPELKTFDNQTSRAIFTIVVSRKWLNRRTNKTDEQSSYFLVVCWSDLAENVAETLRPGMRVLVVGRLEQVSWQDNDGNKRSSVQIVADDVGPSLRWVVADIYDPETGDQLNVDAEVKPRSGASKKSAHDAEGVFSEEPF